MKSRNFRKVWNITPQVLSIFNIISALKWAPDFFERNQLNTEGKRNFATHTDLTVDTTDTKETFETMIVDVIDSFRTQRRSSASQHLLQRNTIEQIAQV